MKDDLANEYATARVELESKDSNVHNKRFLDDAQRPFEEVLQRQLFDKRSDANVEDISARELLEFMNA